jgi:hypothetical protein
MTTEYRDNVFINDADPTAGTAEDVRRANEFINDADPAGVIQATPPTCSHNSRYIASIPTPAQAALANSIKFEADGRAPETALARVVLEMSILASQMYADVTRRLDALDARIAATSAERHDGGGRVPFTTADQRRNARNAHTAADQRKNAHTTTEETPK